MPAQFGKLRDEVCLIIETAQIENKRVMPDVADHRYGQSAKRARQRLKSAARPPAASWRDDDAGGTHSPSTPGTSRSAM